MVEEEPALARLDRRGARSDFQRFPPFAGRAHHVAVVAIVLQIRGRAEEDIAKGGMARIAGPGKQQEFAIDLSWEQDSVPVEGDEGVLVAGETLEILGGRQADRRPIEIPAPKDVIGLFDFHEAWVIGIKRLVRLACFIHEMDGLIVELPAEAIRRAA